MTTDKIYIIGNGFDLYHGMKSRYSDFKNYLVKIDNELVEELEKYFMPEILWSDFESALAEFDTETIVEECSIYIQPYSTDKWKDAYHHDYQFEIESRIDLVTKTLKKRFTEWICQLKFPDHACQKYVRIDRDGFFLNFNYTDTLERIYRIPQDQILYIHNKAIDKHSTLILGHGRKPQENKAIRDAHYTEEIDVRVAEGNQMLDAYFKTTYKSTETIISEKYLFFNNLKSVKEIYVLGHSLSRVDLPYFKEIIKNVNTKNVIWKVSFIDDKELEKHKKTFQNLGVPLKSIEFDKINRFDSIQLKLFQK